MKKRNYYSPVVDIMAVHAAVGMCQAVSKFGSFQMGGAAGTGSNASIDPETNGL